MKLFDCFMYYDEDLLLNIRLNILSKFVDKFVISEAKYLHNGKRKKLNFQINKFEKFKNKIEYIVVDREPKNIIPISSKDDIQTADEKKILNSLKRENFQREMLLKGLVDIDNEDVIMISDIDEIPNLDSFKINELNNDIAIFKQKMFYYKFNLSLPNLNWYGSKACKIKDLKSIDFLRSIKNKSYPFYRLDTLLSDIKHQSVKIVENGGWHFSNLKNLEELERKYLNDENYAEYLLQGYSKEMIKENLINKSIGYNHSAKKDSNERFQSTKLEKIELNNLPTYLLKNLKLYEDWLD